MRSIGRVRGYAASRRAGTPSPVPNPSSDLLRRPPSPSKEKDQERDGDRAAWIPGAQRKLLNQSNRLQLSQPHRSDALNPGA